MNKRATLRDIAKLANVSHITVSRVLRKQNCVSKKLCKKINAIAQKLQYRPDPALSALVAYRTATQPSKYKPVIAWINSYSDPQTLYACREFLYYYEGAKKRCEELGYILEEFKLSELRGSFRRLSKILYTRNIQGVLFAPQERHRSHVTITSFDWDLFSSVTFGFSLTHPKLHVVANAQYRSARLAIQKLKSLGYRRIGCISKHDLEERVDGNFNGGFLIEQSRFPGKDHIPILFLDSPKPAADFSKWCAKYKPDAIFDPHNSTTYLMPSSERKKYGIVHFNLPDHPGEFAGIHQNGNLIGSAAVDEVVSMLHANERGIPKIPRLLLVDGRWMDGASAPRKTSRPPLQSK